MFDKLINKRNMQELRIKKMGKKISELNGTRKQEQILKLKDAKSVLKEMDDIIDIISFYNGRITEEEYTNMKRIFNV